METISKEKEVVALVPVESSNIEAIGFAPGTKEARLYINSKTFIMEPLGELFIKYIGAALYVYEDVPKSLHKELMKAESKGAFFNRKVKGFYKYAKYTIE